MVSSVSSYAPLPTANGNGLGGGCKTTKDANGNAVFDSKNYTITVTSDSQVTIHNKVTGETYQVAGDPHVSVDGKQAFDFKETMTFMLNDGTKVTIDTTPWGSSGATVASRVTITNADANYGVQIYGASAIDGQDISFSETLHNGQMMDEATVDNTVIWENAEGSGFMEVDYVTRLIVAADQKHIDAAEARSAGGMFDPNKPAANSASNGNTTNTATTSSASTNGTPKGSTSMSLSTNSFANYSNSTSATILSKLNGDGGNFDPSTVDIHNLFKSGNVTYKDGGYTYTAKNGCTVTIQQKMGPGTEVLLTVTNPAGLEFTVKLESVNGGQYQVVDQQFGNMDALGIPDSTQKYINDHLAGTGGSGNLLSMLELVNQTTDPSKKKKGVGALGSDAVEGGGAMGADATTGMDGMSSPSDSSWGEDSWFIQMAEGLGEILNKIATKLKKMVDDAKLGDNGQPPYKEGMIIQGLAQQLSFISQALMTALNSLGDSIKSVVTAGGAAR
jgi:Domain of Unknown Function (DUF1521)